MEAQTLLAASGIVYMNVGSQLRRAVRRAARQIERAAPFVPRVGLVLGTGFQAVAQALEVEWEIPYERIAGFPRARVPGHAGRLIFGRWHGVEMAVLSGRAHFYEGHTFSDVTLPVRTLAALGMERVLLTNASGGIARKLRPGDFVLVTDHINWMGCNPLRGVGELGSSPFLDLTMAYDSRLNEELLQAGARAKVRLKPGVYAAVSGPAFETPAEIRAFGRLGADVVGMSTVPEVLAARQCGVRVAAISLVANRAAGLGEGAISHDEVLALAAKRSQAAVRLLSEFFRGGTKNEGRYSKIGLR